MSRSDRPILRAAALGALLVLGLTLSACGRKGPLDPPPASLADQQQPSALGTDTDGRMLAPAGQKKRLPIDWLLD